MKPLALALALLAIALGAAFKDDHYRLQGRGLACDQAALDHRESVYTSMTLVASPAEHYLQLRFFDKVEGGLCLQPTWDDLIAIGKTDARLAHLVPKERPVMAAPGAHWPFPWQPDPGTLSNSGYVRLFPLCLLLNERLGRSVADVRQMRANVLVVGLGSSVGILQLAHHFPNAAITVVDIDQKVIDLVTDHVPITKWLTTQTLPDGMPRLRLVAQDARKFVKFYHPERNPRFDAVILDAYTAGSTIPSHLMTREFFAECRTAMNDDGIMFANVIGSYTGAKHQVLGGALRSFRAAGFTSLVNFPLLRPTEPPGAFDDNGERNNLVVCSAAKLLPKDNAAAWERLRAFELFPELAPGAYVSRQYCLIREADGLINTLSGMLPAEAIDVPDPGFVTAMKTRAVDAAANQAYRLSDSTDHAMVARAQRLAVVWSVANPYATINGWDATDANGITRQEVDWLQAARETWRTSTTIARDITRHGGDALVGPVEETDRSNPSWTIADAPLFTDQQPNADILNH